MTPDEKLAYSESVLFRNRVKAQCLPYCDEVVRENPYTLITGWSDPNAMAVASNEYHVRRVQVSQRCLNSPDLFAQQNAASVALSVPDPVLAEDLALKGAVINLWEVLAGGMPSEPPETQVAREDILEELGRGRRR
jgi:hypothetical protein